MLERWVVAFPKALMCHLCYEEDLEHELKVGLGPPRSVTAGCSLCAFPYIWKVLVFHRLRWLLGCETMKRG